MNRTVRVLISFEVEGTHTDADLDRLLTDAVVQIDEPANAEGERAAFSTRIIGSEWESDTELTELDADTVSALGLDPTGRDGDPRWPYALENLTDAELLTLLFLSDEGTHYPDEAEAPHVGFWLDAAQAEFNRRFGADGQENLAEWSVASHASVADMVRNAREDSAALLDIIHGA